MPATATPEIDPSSTIEPLLLTRTSIAERIQATLTAVPVQAETAAAATPSPSSFPQVTQVTPEPGLPTIAPELSATMPPVVSETISPPSASPVFTLVPSAASATEISGPSSAAIPEIPDVVFLHRGEFPFCLARRYNIDPNQILWLNGFFPGQIYFAGQPVYLPRDPYPFPGDRRLRSHPDSHIVQPGETIYRIACYYGDIDPAYLAELNGLSPDSWLNPGQVLILP